MSQNANTRIASLLTAAEEHSRQGRHAEALQQLRQASDIEPKNDEVQQALNRLQISSAGDTVGEALNRYVENQSADALSNLQQCLVKKDTVSQDDADKCLDIILRQTSQSPWSDILLRLISGQGQARKVIAQRIVSMPESIVKVLLDTSDTASKAVFQVLFDGAAWPIKEDQVAAQQTIFRRFVVQQRSSQETDRPTELMLRQLILSPASVAGLCGEDVFRLLFALLDMRKRQQTRGQALLAFTKLFETKAEAAEAIFERLVVRYATSTNQEELIVAFSTVAALFPVIPKMCAKLLLTDGFLQGLVPLLQRPRVSEVGKEPSSIQSAILELLSAACIDKSCRAAIQQHCLGSLKTLSTQGPQGLQALAALTLAKVSGNTVDPEMVAIMIKLVHLDSPESSLAIEGLAYASLKPAVKEQISADSSLIRRLVTTIGQQYTLSCLNILQNLTAYRPAQSEEQKKMSQLKAYANSSKPAPEDPLDNNGMVSVRCKRLLDVGLVPSLVASFKDFKSLPTLDLAARIVNSLARESKYRTKIVQEGGVKFLLQVYARLETLQHQESSSSQRVAAHALSRVLISVNPEHVFSTALPATSAVSALVPLLKQDQEQEERDLLPTFEALLALTNLASMNDSASGDLIIRKGWQTLEDQLLLSTNVLVQRASTELVCNLMLSPSCVAKFADGSDQATRRLHILLALADVEDLATRRGAGGALAMLTEWDTAVRAITKILRGIKILLSMCADSHDDIKHRGIICVLNCVSIPGEVGSSALAKAKTENGTTILAEALKSTKNADVLTAGIDLLKKLT